MTEHINNNLISHISQEPWEQYLARISQPGYQSPLICDDDIPFTLQEHLKVTMIGKESSNV